ncbi:hypothetical protein [Nonomuraea rhodomycinica]|uniref:Enoyl reductase n=1 Tax=Nonomuraea rhodomycinica TaxID=1712872 RepID=A0A7Y6IN34_9ACTN|nr:hypothetical protein [Nonomuraea rhodomycinica]NUW40986.1 hypothetical protein [Nonomuraea rhodomycinica]
MKPLIAALVAGLLATSAGVHATAAGVHTTGAGVRATGAGPAAAAGVRGVSAAVRGKAPARDPGGGSPEVTGTQKGRTSVISLKNSRIVLSGNGVKAGRRDGYRLTSPCWYEPGPTPEEMLKQQSDSATHFNRIKAGEESFLRFLEQFKDKIGKPGRWWTPAYSEDDPRGISCWTGLEMFIFVPPNTTPPQGITVRELTDIARAALTVPEPKVRLNPDAKSFVNLPTWVWLDGVGETRRTATATIPGVMSATVVATLKSIDIDPGTSGDRAKVAEDCGASGKPYVKGGTYTCGVSYLRASLDQPREVYQLTVTTVWPVEVADPGVDVQYQPVRVGVTRDVPVGEVQSSVRDDGATG